MTPSDQLVELANLYDKRNQEYGPNYKEAGPVLEALFTKGVELDTPLNFNRFCIIVHIITKLMRYCNNFYTPENSDHLKDMAVYATILLELDEEKRP
jgi:hypothetical protein